jgi:hypothetical protein
MALANGTGLSGNLVRKKDACVMEAAVKVSVCCRLRRLIP